MIVLSVSKTYWNRGVKRHRKNARKIWVVYYIDEDDGSLGTKRINPLTVPYYRSIRHKKKQCFCLRCGFIGTLLYRKEKEIFEKECPICDDPDITLSPTGYLIAKEEERLFDPDI